MFHPPQAAIALALLPVAWAANDRARAERGGSAVREREQDLSRYFPPGWSRETVPDWPVAAPSRSRRAAALPRVAALRVAIRWRASWLGGLLRITLQRSIGRVRGSLRS